MELYLTFHKVLDKLQEFQENYCCLNSFGYGNLVDFGKNVSGQTVSYPYLFIVPLSVSYDQNTTTYQLSAIFADRLNESLDNEKDAVSDMSLAARQLLSEIWRGNLQDYFDAPLPVNGQPFMERFNDYVAGVAIDLNLTVMEDINACPQWVITPFPTPSITPTPTCPTTTQYLEVELFDSTKFRLKLWNNSGFTSTANALCNYVISGTATGSLGTVYSGTETINSGQHQHQFNLSPVLLPGETVSSFVVHSYQLVGCACPVNLILPT